MNNDNNRRNNDNNGRNNDHAPFQIARVNGRGTRHIVEKGYEDNDVDKTSVYRPVSSNAGLKSNEKVKKSKKSSSFGTRDDEREGLFVERTRPRSTVLAIVFGVVKCFLVVGILCGFILMGLLLGIAKAYIDTTPALDVSALTKSDRTSYIYDCNGNQITTYASMEFRDWAKIDEIPDTLKNALIAVEDVRFYKHGGLDFKRLFSAVVNTFRNANTHGGSTITQQLIKNQVLTNIQSYKRKIQEAYLAYELESTVSKDLILEAYMNDVYLGDSNYGFKTAAKDYFGKDMNELTIRECAMLAGMVQKPNYTNPRANTYKRFNEDGTNKMSITNQRTDTVLKHMYEAEFITLEEYEQALSEEVRILEISSQKQLYDMAYFVEYGIYDVITNMLKVRDLEDNSSNRSMIERELRTGGYKIYLTVDPDIQNATQEIISNWDQYPALRNSSAGIITDPTSGMTIQQPQASAVIMDQTTGELKAMIGGRYEPTQKRQLNRAYQSTTPVGSAIKPLTIYGPALDAGLNPATGILNAKVRIDGYGGENGYPSLGSSRWEGIVSMRRGITSSLNIVAARLLFDVVTTEQSAAYLESLGVPRQRINQDGPGLALGTSDISPLEMAAAYACIANNGVYIKPVAFIKVVAPDGKVILDAEDVREEHRVYKESTAYMLVDMMKDVVNHGTGTAAIIPGITVAGKTGTNDDYTSAYFAGFTGYYTASLWVGHDMYSEKLASGSTGGTAAAPLWQAFMSKIHEGLSDKPIIDASPVDAGLTQVTICPVSGKMATDACMNDAVNQPITEWCAVESVPSEYCDMHCGIDLCSDSDKPSSINCPEETRVRGCVVLIHPDSIYARLEDEELYSIIPNAVKTDLDLNSFAANYLQYSMLCCPLHTTENPIEDIEDLYRRAGTLIAEVNAYLDSVQTLGQEDRDLLMQNILALQEALAEADVQKIMLAMQELKQNYNVLCEQYPPVVGPNS